MHIMLAKYLLYKGQTATSYCIVKSLCSKKVWQIGTAESLAEKTFADEVNLQYDLYMMFHFFKTLSTAIHTSNGFCSIQCRALGQGVDMPLHGKFFITKNKSTKLTKLRKSAIFIDASCSF